MKRLTCIALLFVAAQSLGAGANLCSVSVTSTSKNLMKPLVSTDGGSCPVLSVLGGDEFLLQCPGAEVCINPKAGGTITNWPNYDGGYPVDGGLDDGGTNPTLENSAAATTTNHECFNFVDPVSDPRLVSLATGERTVAIVLKGIADGGSAVVCKVLDNHKNTRAK